MYLYSPGYTLAPHTWCTHKHTNSQLYGCESVCADVSFGLPLRPTLTPTCFYSHACDYCGRVGECAGSSWFPLVKWQGTSLLLDVPMLSLHLFFHVFRKLFIRSQPFERHFTVTESFHFIQLRYVNAKSLHKWLQTSSPVWEIASSGDYWS